MVKISRPFNFATSRANIDEMTDGETIDKQVWRTNCAYAPTEGGGLLLVRSPVDNLLFLLTIKNF